MLKVSDKKIIEYAKEYKLTRDVSEEECPMAQVKCCGSCMYQVEPDDWGDGLHPTVCYAVHKEKVEK